MFLSCLNIYIMFIYIIFIMFKIYKLHTTQIPSLTSMKSWKRSAFSGEKEGEENLRNVYKAAGLTQALLGPNSLCPRGRFQVGLPTPTWGHLWKKNTYSPPLPFLLAWPSSRGTPCGKERMAPGHLQLRGTGLTCVHGQGCWLAGSSFHPCTLSCMS